MKNKRSKEEKQNKKQGSSDFGEPEFICIGKIHRSHGLDGTVVFNPMTDFPDRIRKGRKVYFGETHLPLEILSVRDHPPYLLVQLSGVTTPEEAFEMRNQFLFVRADELPKLPEGRFYFHQLTGFDVVDMDGNRIGKLREILETGANDVYVVVKNDGEEVLAAGIPEVIREVRLDERIIIMNLPAWY